MCVGVCVMCVGVCVCVCVGGVQYLLTHNSLLTLVIQAL